MDLFSDREDRNIRSAEPLAVRMRPRRLDEFVGQESFIGVGKLLWRMLKADRLTSLIFYGPPGTGKTALAHVIAQHCSCRFISANAATIGVAQIRKLLADAKDRLAAEQGKTVLFLDEIHRFSRSQQDVLLDDVERGIVTLIGATTENPFFTVNSALVSRSTIFEFQLLTEQDITKILKVAIADKDRGMGRYNVRITDEAIEYLSLMADGDARRALTALEIGLLSSDEIDREILFDKRLAIESIQRKSIVSDAAGDTHYDLASALQKSMRGSDPDATVYWLARLIVGGEDPRFIARRIAVCAAEDVGNADPMATVLAAAAVRISEFIGLPEAQLPLSQAAIYIACAPKSNRTTKAISAAIEDVKHGKTIQVPPYLRDGHYRSAKKLDRGVGYKYPHNYKNGYVEQEYLPGAGKGKYYQPSEHGHERQMAEFLAKLRCELDKMSEKK